MAQEILPINPDAVVHDDFGYMYVNYDMLGLRMLTWEEWESGVDVSSHSDVRIEIER
jgi:hypothetical protein